jgi:hypothetical protein
VQVSRSVLIVLISSPGVCGQLALVGNRWKDILGMDGVHEDLTPVAHVHICCM